MDIDLDFYLLIWLALFVFALWGGLLAAYPQITGDED